MMVTEFIVLGILIILYALSRYRDTIVNDKARLVIDVAGGFLTFLTLIIYVV